MKLAFGLNGLVTPLAGPCPFFFAGSGTVLDSESKDNFCSKFAVSEDGARVAMIQMKVKIARLSREEDGEKKREEKLGEGVAAATVLLWVFGVLVF